MKQFDNQEIQNYFETLPAFVQESVMQSGVVINSVEQLKNCAQHIMENNIVK